MTDRERLIELVGNYPCMSTAEDCFMESIASDLADHLLANGVIVPPCKVGDLVYVLEDFVWTCDCENCEHYEEGWYDSPSECGKTRSCRKSPECIEIAERTVTHKDILRYMSWDEFGKTVFPTKEEAEKALAERIGK